LFLSLKNEKPIKNETTSLKNNVPNRKRAIIARTDQLIIERSPEQFID